MDANQSAARFYGYPLATLRDMNAAQLNAASDAQALFRWWDHADREVPSPALQHLTSHAQVRMVEVHATTLRIDNQDLLFTIVQDITERIQARDRLTEQNAELDDLYHQAPCGYHSLDSNGLIQRVNDTELHWLGRTRSEVVGNAFEAFLTSESRDAFRAVQASLRSGMDLRSLELELIGRDGTGFPVLASVSPQFGPDGKTRVGVPRSLTCTGYARSSKR